MSKRHEAYLDVKNTVRNLLKQPSCSIFNAEKINAIGKADTELNNNIVESIAKDATVDDCLKYLNRVQKDYDKKIHEIKELLILMYTNQVNNDAELKDYILHSNELILDQIIITLKETDDKINIVKDEVTDSTPIANTTDTQPAQTSSGLNIGDILDRAERIITNPSTWKILIPITIVLLSVLLLAHFNPDAFATVTDFIKHLVKG